MTTSGLVSPQNNTTAWVPVAKVAGAHGLRGTLKLYPFDADPFWLETIDTFYLAHAETPEALDTRTLTLYEVDALESVGPHKVRLSVSQLKNRTQAEACVGKTLFIPQSLFQEHWESHELDDSLIDAYLPSQLVGYTLVSCDSQAPLGIVSDTLSTAQSSDSAALSGDFLEVTLYPPAAETAEAVTSASGEQKASPAVVVLPLQPAFFPKVLPAQKQLMVDKLDAFFQAEWEQHLEHQRQKAHKATRPKKQAPQRKKRSQL